MTNSLNGNNSPTTSTSALTWWQLAVQAIGNGELETLKHLLLEPLHIHSAEAQQSSPTNIAIRNFGVEDWLQRDAWDERTKRILNDCKNNPILVNAFNIDSSTDENDSLNITVKNEIKKTFQNNQLSVKDKDSDDNTLLHWAAYFGQNAIVLFLLTLDANLLLRNKKGETALSIKGADGHNLLLRPLYDGSSKSTITTFYNDLESSNKSIENTIKLALTQWAEAERPIETVESEGATTRFLHHAAQQGFGDIVLEFIQNKKVDITATNHKKETIFTIKNDADKNLFAQLAEQHRGDIAFQLYDRLYAESEALSDTIKTGADKSNKGKQNVNTHQQELSFGNFTKQHDLSNMLKAAMEQLKNAPGKAGQLLVIQAIEKERLDIIKTLFETGIDFCQEVTVTKTKKTTIMVSPFQKLKTLEPSQREEIYAYLKQSTDDLLAIPTRTTRFQRSVTNEAQKYENKMISAQTGFFSSIKRWWYAVDKTTLSTKQQQARDVLWACIESVISCKELGLSKVLTDFVAQMQKEHPLASQKKFKPRDQTKWLSSLDDPVTTNFKTSLAKATTDPKFSNLKKEIDEAKELKEKNATLTTELGDAKTELGDTQTKLGDTQTELGDTQTKLGDTQTELDKYRQHFGSLPKEGLPNKDEDEAANTPSTSKTKVKEQKADTSLSPKFDFFLQPDRQKSKNEAKQERNQTRERSHSF